MVEEMNISVSEDLLARLSEFIAIEMGLHFPKNRWRDLERGMNSACKELDFKSVEHCVEWILSSPLTKMQIEILANHLTVGETYFFRDMKGFEILGKYVLQELISSRRLAEKRLRIWSAACCTGEEPYSLAIFLHSMIPDLKDWNITILATDINNNFLKKASEGIYNKWSFRDVPSWIKEGYFEKTKEGRYKILPHIQKMVSFFYLNLIEDVYPSLPNNTNAMDIIFCRNVLMYFVPGKAQRVIKKLYDSLIYGGWLLLSATETCFANNSQFVPVHYPGVTFHRKDRRRSQMRDDLTPEESLFYGKQEKTTFFDKPFFVPVGEPEHQAPLQQETGKHIQPGYDESKTKETEQNSYTKAVELYERGRFAETTENLVDLITENQKDTKLTVLLARAYANQGKLAEALKWIDKSIALEKLNPVFHYLRAIILNEQGLIDEAVSSLKRALYLDQNFVLAHFTLGNLSRNLRKIKEADKHFKNALSLLSRYGNEDILPESEGITAGRLMEIIRLMIVDLQSTIINRQSSIRGEAFYE